MNTSDIIKYGAFAVAAYLVYRYLKDQGLFGAPENILGPPVPPPAVIPTPVGGPPATVVQPGPTTVVQAADVTPEMRTAAIYFAALGKTSAIGAGFTGTWNPVAVVRALGITMNSDEWNFYRGEAGGDVPNVDLFPPGNRDYPMTIDEYLTARTSKGLAGLGDLLARMRAVNEWVV